MKRVVKTDIVNQRLRAAFGQDANIANLAVWETIALTTLPVRKGSGIFKGARNTLSLLTELVASTNKESLPLQVQHNPTELPYGRFFYAEMVDDEMRGLFALDETRHPDIANDIDNGVIDQVSVNFLPKRLNCSACGFNFADPKHVINMITLTCDDGHTVGQDGVFVHVDGLEQFYELSLVGKGGADGARILGPSDARLTQSNEQYRLAASANPGLLALQITPTRKDPSDMNAEQMARFEAAISEKATAAAQLTVVTGERDAVQAQLTAVQAELATAQTALTAAQEASAASAANKAAADAALAALTEELKVVLTACNKPTENLPTEIDAVLAAIKEHRAQFAGIVPVNGKANGSTDDATTQTPARSVAAFRAPN